MAYGEERGKYWHARWKRADGTTGSKSKNPATGRRFATEREAEKWGEEQEVLERLGLVTQPEPEIDEGITVNEWFAKWWPAQDLGLRSRGNYGYLFRAHILPEWGEWKLKKITANLVNAWEQRMLAAGYGRGGVAGNARSKFATLLGDAVAEGLIDSNPALRQKRRGRRSGVGTGGRKAQKIVATPFQVLAFAERLSVLSGRDDDFIFALLLAYTALRWAEAVGLQPQYVKLRKLRVDWQLEEAEDGKLYWLPPKDDSNRDIDLPAFLTDLLSRLKQDRPAQKCRCRPVVVEGQKEQPCQGGKRLMFLGPRGGHPRNSNYARDFVDPAADGKYAAEKGRSRSRPARRVLVNLGPGTVWPGEPWPHWESVTRGFQSGSRIYDPGDERVALAEWAPILEGLSPHDLRHAHSSWLGDLGTPLALRDERMGHVSPEMRGMRGTYTHVSEESRVKLAAQLQELWEVSLAERAGFGLHSPVAVLDQLLAPFRDGKRTPVSPVAPRADVIELRRRDTG